MNLLTAITALYERLVKRDAETPKTPVQEALDRATDKVLGPHVK